MLFVAVALGIVAGLLAGGRLSNLLSAQLRFGALIVGGLLLRVATQWFIDQGVEIVDQLRVLLFGASFGMLVVALWLNRSQPGLSLAMVGIGANGIAVVVNGGYMPVWMPAVEMAGLTAADLSPTFHVLLPDELNLEFLLAAGPLGDVIPITIPFLSNVISLGDVMLAVGVGWFQIVQFVRQFPQIWAPRLGAAFEVVPALVFELGLQFAQTVQEAVPLRA